MNFKEYIIYVRDRRKKKFVPLKESLVYNSFEEAEREYMKLMKGTGMNQIQFEREYTIVRER